MTHLSHRIEASIADLESALRRSAAKRGRHFPVALEVPILEAIRGDIAAERWMSANVHIGDLMKIQGEPPADAVPLIGVLTQLLEQGEARNEHH